jgi:hypothetical protein
MTTRNTYSPPTVRERMADLTDRQLAALEQVAIAKRNYDQAGIGYAQAIERANKLEVSFGMMSVKIGLPKETIWRRLQRYLKDPEKVESKATY